MSEPKRPDDLFETALARGLRRDQVTVDGCPDPDTLAVYWERALDVDERTDLEAHVAACARCQAQLAALTRSVADDDSDAAAPAASPRVLGWLLDVRWLAPAASVAAVLLAVWIIQPELIRDAPDVVRDTPSQAAQAPAARPENRRVTPPATPDRIEREANTEAVPQAETVPQTPVDARKEEAVEANELGRAREERETTSRDQLGERAQSVSAPLEDDLAAVNEELNAAEPTIERESRTDQPRENTTGARAAPRRSAEIESFAPEAARGAGSLDSRGLSDADVAAVVVLAAPDSPVRWRSTRDGTIERSTDGGTSWTVQRSGTAGERWLAGAASSSSSAWFVGTGGSSIRTGDGVTWQAATLPTTEDLTAVETESALTATVRTRTGRRYETTDGGNTWREQENPR